MALRPRRPNHFLRYGVPLVSLVVLGYAGMGHLMQGRRDLQNAQDDEAWAMLGATMELTRKGPSEGSQPRPKIDLEEELKKLKAKVNIDNFEYQPVPRPKPRPE